MDPKLGSMSDALPDCRTNQICGSKTDQTSPLPLPHCVHEDCNIRFVVEEDTPPY